MNKIKLFFFKNYEIIIVNTIFLMKYKLLLSFLFFIFLIFPPASHAYAGPGVAIGAIIVALTVVIAFFASTILGIFSFFKKVFNKRFIKNKDKKINKKRANKI